ncbi:hypothetical protein AMK59_2455 [Oryctes borbonicus]|uniref:Transposable element P transposase-like RNase H C-terminal domain-containing protein n=1 Tax=Oryctes borbonicus TaxID=1629725 RepID=A0A0T6BE60_9SCAR|nr:hypothetical protein AMK59_2455 [Oryctes borbonicus]
MFYECKTTKKVSRPPTLKHWIDTISGMQYLWRKINSLGYKYLIPSHLNQASIENFFCRIRSYGICNTNPTRSNFANSFKTLIINNFTSTKSVSGNCEDDLSTKVFSNVRDLIQRRLGQEQIQQTIRLQISSDIDQQSVHLEAYVARKVLLMTKNCETCMSNLIGQDERSEHMLIIVQRFTNKHLLLPTTRFTSIFHHCATLVTKIFPELCINFNISKLSVDIVKSVDYSQIICIVHPNLKELIVTHRSAKIS